MLKAIAIDDEPIALQVIKKIAETVHYMEISACFTSALGAKEYLQHNKADLLFLDIEMPGFSGFDFLMSLPIKPMIVFTTAYSEHAAKSFEFDVIDYLLKPFSPSRFQKACDKAYQQFQLRVNNSGWLRQRSTFIKCGYEQIRLELDEVLFIESIGNYVRFELVNNQSHISRITMAEAETIFPGDTFMRIHRSFIVSIKKITRMDKKKIWLNEKEFPVGSAYSEKIEKLMAGEL